MFFLFKNYYFNNAYKEDELILGSLQRILINKFLNNSFIFQLLKSFLIFHKILKLIFYFYYEVKHIYI